MFHLSKVERVFLILVSILIIVSSLEYVYMDKNSVKTLQKNEINSLLRLGYTSQEINDRFYTYDDEEDGIYSPVIQLAIIAGTLFVLGIWFSIWISCSMGLFEGSWDAGLMKASLTITCIVLFWVTVADVVIFLMSLSK